MKIRKIFILLALAVTGYWLPVVFVYAEAPNLLTYQGRLKESGQPFTGNKDITISLCADSAGAVCYPSPLQSAYVSSGLFKSTFTVPSGVNLSTGEWYLKIQVGGVTLIPFEKLTSSVYSLYATTAAYANNLAASPGAPGIFVSTNFFVAAGNVGIGTTVPGGVLEVKQQADADATYLRMGRAVRQYWDFKTVGQSRDLILQPWLSSAGDPALFKINNGDGTTKLTFDAYNGNVGIGTANPGSRFEVVGGSSTFRGNDSNSAIAGFTDAGGNYRLMISTLGNVGVGTSSPQNPLHIVSPAIEQVALMIDGNNTSWDSLYIASLGSGKPGMGYLKGGLKAHHYLAGDDSWRLRTGISLIDRITVSSAGAVGVGTISPAAALHISSPAATATTPIFIVSSGAAVNQELLWVQRDGSVGIGTTGPLSKFDVVDGSITVRGTNAGLTLQDANRVVSPETNAALGAGIRISTNVYIVGFSSATKYYGDGSALTGVTASGGVAKTGDTMTGKLTAPDYAATYGIAAATAAFTGGITAATYRIAGSTVLAVLQGTGSLGVGTNAGRVNTGNYNVFVGSAAGYSSITGNNNSFVGYSAGYFNDVFGDDNSFVGFFAGYKNATGFSNSFLGASAGYSNTDGVRNSFLGASAGYSNTTSSNNSFLGTSAGYYNIGSNNSFLGTYAGLYNTSGSNNSFVGYSAGYYNKTGSANSIFGNEAGYGVSGNSFSSSTLMGYRAGYSLQNGSADNIFLGFQAGYNVTTGSGNIIIGYNKDATAPTTNNFLNIGGVLYGDLSAKTIGISIQAPQAALDIISTGAYAQIWRDSSGLVVASMTATGRLSGDGSGLTGITAAGSVSRTGDTMTGRLTISGSTLTVIASDAFASSLWVSTSASTPHLYVSTGGNVGIGTTGSAHRLESVLSTGSNPNKQINAKASSPTGDAMIGLEPANGGLKNWSIMVLGAGLTVGDLRIQEDGGDTRLTIQDTTGNVGIGTTGPNARLDVISSTSTAYSLSVGTSTAYSMVVSTSGNVGIGTTTPGAALDVVNALGDQTIRVQANGNPGLTALRTAGGELDLGISNGPPAWFLSGISAGDAVIRYSAAQSLRIGNNPGGSPHVTINSGGNFGIGTTGPTHKLRVEGGILAISSITANDGFYGAGSTSTLAGNAIMVSIGSIPRMIQSGSGTLVAGTQSVTFIQAFRSGTTPIVVLTDTTAISAMQVSAVSGTGFTATGSATDTYNWIAIGAVP